MEISSAGGNQSPQTMEIIQVSLLKKQLQREQAQQLQLLESATPKSQGGAQGGSQVGRYLNVSA